MSRSVLWTCHLAPPVTTAAGLAAFVLLKAVPGMPPQSWLISGVLVVVASVTGICWLSFVNSAKRVHGGGQANSLISSYLVSQFVLCLVGLLGIWAGISLFAEVPAENSALPAEGQDILPAGESPSVL